MVFDPVFYGCMRKQTALGFEFWGGANARVGVDAGSIVLAKSVGCKSELEPEICAVCESTASVWYFLSIRYSESSERDSQWR